MRSWISSTESSSVKNAALENKRVQGLPTILPTMTMSTMTRGPRKVLLSLQSIYTDQPTQYVEKLKCWHNSSAELQKVFDTKVEKIIQAIDRVLSHAGYNYPSKQIVSQRVENY